MNIEFIKSCVVRIVAPTRTGFVVCGTGFVVGDQGMVVTCWHVIQDALTKAQVGSEQVFAQFGDETPIAYRELDHDPISDLSLLTRNVDRSRRARLPLADPVEPTLPDGTSIDGFGVAYDTVQGSRLIPGKISNIDPLRSRYVLDATIHPGDSGGPIVDRAGRVVGIISSRHGEYEGIGKGIPVRLLHELIRRSRNATAFYEYIDDVRDASATLFDRLQGDLRDLISEKEAYRAYTKLQLLDSRLRPITLDAILRRVSVNPALAIKFLAYAVNAVTRYKTEIRDIKAVIARDYRREDRDEPVENVSARTRLPVLVGVVRNTEACEGEYFLHAWTGTPWSKLDLPNGSTSFGRGGLDMVVAEAVDEALQEALRRGDRSLSLDFVLPMELIDKAVDRVAYGGGIYFVGEDYRVTVRLLDRLRETHPRYLLDWQDRWEKLRDSPQILDHAKVVSALPSTGLRQSICGKPAIVALSGPETGDHHSALCEELIDEKVLLAIWLRDPSDANLNQFEMLIDRPLEALLQTIDDLRQRDDCSVCGELSRASFTVLLDPYEEDMPPELAASG